MCQYIGDNHEKFDKAQNNKNYLVTTIFIIDSNIRIYYEFVDRIDNSVLRVTAWYQEALPKDRFVYPIHKLILDSFSCILLGASTLINSVLP